jgi:hypothetical protein
VAKRQITISNTNIIMLSIPQFIRKASFLKHNTTLFIGMVLLLVISYLLFTAVKKGVRNPFGSLGAFEGFTDGSSNSCPNILVQHDAKFYLYNSKKDKVPGVNPIQFNNLEDYTEFIDWQNANNINCPVLFLQHTYDTSGGSSYKVRPSPMDLQGGLPPVMGNGGQPNLPMPPSGTTDLSQIYDESHDKPAFGATEYTGMDPEGQLIGDYTDLDALFTQPDDGSASANPMDNNWGGTAYSSMAVSRGDYTGNEVGGAHQQL